MSTSQANDLQARNSPTIFVVIAWTIVGVPALWGVSQTVLKAVDLFRPTVVVAATQPSAAAVPPASQPATLPATSPAAR